MKVIGRATDCYGSPNYTVILEAETVELRTILGEPYKDIKIRTGQIIPVCKRFETLTCLEGQAQALEKQAQALEGLATVIRSMAVLAEEITKPTEKENDA